ncbi:MAG: hypothetical protein IT176_11835 [Acidobacteria bacterium]|nr:hypothetical protein [Acidobacteriota bacterium]
MRFGGFSLMTLLAGLAALAAPAVEAQAPGAGARLSALQIGIACAPPPVAVAVPRDAVRVLGAQAPEPRTVLGATDRVVLSGGTANGLAVGQRFFVRRPMVDPLLHAGRDHPWPQQTTGWVTIAAADATTAIATVDNACGPIEAGDHIQPFVAPAPPPGIDQVEPSGGLDFLSAAHVLSGSDRHGNSSAGDYVLVDVGADRGLAPGAAVAFYRDPGVDGMPLVSIAEGAVVSVGPSMSLVRVNQGRTEVRRGDYLVPGK